MTTAACVKLEGCPVQLPVPVWGDKNKDEGGEKPLKNPHPLRCVCSLALNEQVCALLLNSSQVSLCVSVCVCVHVGVKLGVPKECTHAQ